MLILSVDLETTGLNPNTCQIIQAGGILFDSESETEPSSDQCPFFNFFVEHEIYTGQPYALQMNAWILRELSKKRDLRSLATLNINKLGKGLLRWLEEEMGDDRIIFAGKNFQSFDRQFLLASGCKDFCQRGGHRALDPGSMFCRADDLQPPNLQACAKRAGMGDIEIPHDALADSVLVARIIWRYLNWEKVHCTQTNEKLAS